MVIADIQSKHANLMFAQFWSFWCCLLHQLSEFLWATHKVRKEELTSCVYIIIFHNPKAFKHPKDLMCPVWAS